MVQVEVQIFGQGMTQEQIADAQSGIPDFFPAHLAEVFAVQLHEDSLPQTGSRYVFLVGFRGNAKGRWDPEPALCHAGEGKSLAPDRVALVLVNLVKNDRPSHAATCNSMTS